MLSIADDGAPAEVIAERSAEVLLGNLREKVALMLRLLIEARRAGRFEPGRRPQPPEGTP
jgi:hypothetical protein